MWPSSPSSSWATSINYTWNSCWWISECPFSWISFGSSSKPLYPLPYLAILEPQPSDPSLDHPNALPQIHVLLRHHPHDLQGNPSFYSRSSCCCSSSDTETTTNPSANQCQSLATCSRSTAEWSKTTRFPVSYPAEVSKQVDLMNDLWWNNLPLMGVWVCWGWNSGNLSFYWIEIQVNHLLSISKHDVWQGSRRRTIRRGYAYRLVQKSDEHCQHQRQTYPTLCLHSPRLILQHLLFLAK